MVVLPILGRCRQSSHHSEYRRSVALGPPNVLSDAVSLGGEKFPTDFEFLCASFGWLGVVFEKKN